MVLSKKRGRRHGDERDFSLQKLEARTLLSAISNLAYSFLNTNVAANRTSFYVYKDGDSPRCPTACPALANT